MHPDDDEGQPVDSFVCRVLDDKGKKSDTSVTFKSDKLDELKNSFEIEVKVHLSSSESFETKMRVPVKRGILVDHVLKQLE